MNSATITFEPDVKLEAQRTARQLGLSLSGLINRLLRDFVKAKKIEYDESHPTQYMIDSLRESEEDYKAGRYISFNSVDDAIKYLRKEIKDERQSKN